MRRFSFIVIALAALILFSRPLATGEVFTFRDHTDYFQPLRWFTAQALQHGELPLWNPYNSSGEPWLANPQTCVFYPPAWLFLVLPFPTAYTLFLLLHVALLGVGAFLFFSHRASEGAALIGAIALMACGPVLSLLDVQNNLMTFTWIPLILWCAVSRAPVNASAVAIAMSFLAGEPFFATIGAVLFAIVRRRDLVTIGARAAGLCAVQLLPFLEMLRGSDRLQHVPRELLFRDSMPLRDWLRLGVPPHLDASGFDPAIGQHFIPIVYVGILIVSLAAIGIVAARRRALGWLALLAGAVVVAAGAYLPISAAILSHLPLTPFRYPARVVPLGALAVIALAVEGFDAVARLTSIRWLAPFIAVALFADLASHAVPLLATAPFDPHLPYDHVVGRDAKLMRVVASPGDLTADRRAWLSGYLNLYERRFDVWTAAPLGSQRYAELYAKAIAPRPDLLASMSVGYILAPHPLPGLMPLQRVRSVIAQRNPRAFPLAYARVGPAVIGPSLLSFGSSFVHATIDIPAAGTFVVTQQDAPGWSARVDGNDAVASRGEIFRSVNLSPGHHDVVWKYRPASLLVGGVVTLLTMFAMLFGKKFVKR